MGRKKELMDELMGLWDQEDQPVSARMAVSMERQQQQAMAALAQQQQVALAQIAAMHAGTLAFADKVLDRHLSLLSERARRTESLARSQEGEAAVGGETPFHQEPPAGSSSPPFEEDPSPRRMTQAEVIRSLADLQAGMPGAVGPLPEG